MGGSIESKQAFQPQLVLNPISFKPHIIVHYIKVNIASTKKNNTNN